MKNTLMALAAVAAMSGFAAQNDLLVTLSAKEKLTYKNNEAVNNEVVALVWTPAGATFGGFLANGSLKDADSKVLARIVVKDGLFETTTFQIDAELAEQMKLTQGAFSLYLLDTRDASGKTVVENGATDLAQATIPVNYTAKILEGSVDASAGGIATSIESDGTAAGTIVAEGQTELPIKEELLAPIIKSVKVEGDKFKVTIEKAVPYMKYDLIDASSKEAIGDSAKSGVVTETVTLETSADAPSKLIQVSAGRNQ